MRRVLLTALTWLALAGAAHAQVIGQPTILSAQSSSVCATTNAFIAANIGNAASVSFGITGTWSGTLTFKSTADGSTWVTTQVTNLGSGTTPVTTTTSNGQFGLSNSGLLSVCVDFTTRASGSATVTVTRGWSAKGGGATSGGGGGVTGGTCTNQVTTAIDTSGVPTCATVTSAYVDSSVATVGAANVFTATQTIVKSGLAATSTDGAVLQNTTASTLAVPVQTAPRVTWKGTAWDTSAAASKTMTVYDEALPVSLSGKISSVYQMRYIDPDNTSELNYGIRLGMGTGLTDTFLGNRAGLAYLTIGNGENTVVGVAAGSTQTGLSELTAFGYHAGKDSSGAQNTFIGSLAGPVNGASSGAGNTVVGEGSLGNLLAGNDNVAIGKVTLTGVDAGSGNTAIGTQACRGATGASAGLVCVGQLAGRFETGSNAFYVDNQSRTNTAGDKAGALLYGTFSATPASQTLTTNSLFNATYGVQVAGVTVVSPTGPTHLTAGSGMAVANVGANSCGTTAATIAGNNNAGEVTVGATSGTQCRIAFTVTATTKWQCIASDETTAVLARGVPVDTTHADLVGVFTAGDVVTYHCDPR